MDTPSRWSGDSSTSPSALSRRVFLKLGMVLASMLALPPRAAAELTAALGRGTPRRQALIWLSFQECTGCTESLTRAYAPTLERLLFDLLSLDYHHTLQAAAGEAAELAREASIAANRGHYLLVVDGAVPLGAHGACSTIAGQSNIDLLGHCVEGAAAVVSLGTCAAFGGLPAAAPNPTGAQGVAELMAGGRVARRPLVNLPGCPPIPEAIAATLAHFLVFGGFPALDEQSRPLAFYGHTVHERCYRYPYFVAGQFAASFDDEGARKGWCLYRLGCRGPVTHSACATVKWNQGVSFPIEAGHPCIGCTEPGFWDGGGFYNDLDRLTAAVTSKPEDADPARLGAGLFEEDCVYCHSADPARLRTPADEVPAMLESGGVRSHARLKYSEAEMEALVDYLRGARGAK